MEEGHSPEKQGLDRWLYTIPVLLLSHLVLYFLMEARLGMPASTILWHLGPFIVALIAMVILPISLYISFRNRPFWNRWRALGYTGLFLSLFFGMEGYHSAYPSSYDNTPSRVQFRLPLDEEIAVSWGGATLEMNYHVPSPDQRWAYDLSATKDGKNFQNEGKEVLDYYSYGLPILAPAGGKVVAAQDNEPDMPIGELGGGSTPLGNHVIIRVASKQYLFLAHLKPNSLQVSVGDQIEKGQVIGKVGNSGNTTNPHIHIHLQDSAEFGLGEGIPLYFHQYQLGDQYIGRGIPTGGFRGGEFIGQIIKHSPQ